MLRILSICNRRQPKSNLRSARLRVGIILNATLVATVNRLQIAAHRLHRERRVAQLSGAIERTRALRHYIDIARPSHAERLQLAALNGHERVFTINKQRGTCSRCQSRRWRWRRRINYERMRELLLVFTITAINIHSFRKQRNVTIGIAYFKKIKFSKHYFLID